MEIESATGADNLLFPTGHGDCLLNGTLSSSSDSDVEIVKELKTTLDKHACDLCCEGDFLVSRLLQYGGVLNKDLKYVCEICEKAFKAESGLVKHMNIHSNSKEVTSVSNGNTSNASPLNSSNLSNFPDSSNQSPAIRFYCEFCTNNYKTKKYLRAHIRKKHTDRTYVCEVCKLVYTDFSEFKKHCSSMLHAPPVQNYNCLNCKDTFSSKEVYMEHVCSDDT